MLPVQDAHEFLNYLLNECSELLEKEAKARAAKEEASGQAASASSAPSQQQQIEGQSAQSDPGSSPQHKAQPATWVHELFQVRSALYNAGYPATPEITVRGKLL